MLSVKINDKDYTFCWGTLTFMRTCNELDITLHELDTGMLSGKDEYWHKLSYNALISHDLIFNNGANVFNDTLTDLSFYQYVYWLDNSDPETNTRISKSYEESMYLGKTMRQHYDELIARVNSLNDGAEGDTTKKKNKRLAK